MRIIHIVIALLFTLFALVQFNDPDPWLWVLMYGLVAYIAGLAFFKEYYPWLIKSTLLAAIIWLFTLTPSIIDWFEMGMPSIADSMKSETPYIELAREFFGLVICIGVLVFYHFQSKKKLPNQILD